MQTIDLSDLSPQAAQVVESLVQLLRQPAPGVASRKPSVFELFGKAPKLRTTTEIDRQVQEERDAWGEP